jgi:uncharacterized protein
VAAGVMAGLFGVGGGVVLVPGWSCCSGSPSTVAHATSLVAILVTAPGGHARVRARRRRRLPPGAAVAVGAVLGAFAGAAIMHRLSGSRLRQGFAVLLRASSPSAWRSPSRRPPRTSSPPDLPSSPRSCSSAWPPARCRRSWAWAAGSSSSPRSSCCSASPSTRRGHLPARHHPHRLAGALRHARHGYTDWRLGVPIGVGGVVGGLLGSQLALALSGPVLQQLFAAFLVITGLRMLWGSRRAGEARGPEAG